MAEGTTCLEKSDIRDLSHQQSFIDLRNNRKLEATPIGRQGEIFASAVESPSTPKSLRTTSCSQSSPSRIDSPCCRSRANRIDPLNAFALSISKDLTEANVANMKLLLKTPFSLETHHTISLPDGILEHVEKGRDLILALFKIMSSEDEFLEVLHDLLHKDDLKKLARKVKAYRDTLKPRHLDQPGTFYLGSDLQTITTMKGVHMSEIARRPMDVTSRKVLYTTDSGDVLCENKDKETVTVIPKSVWEKTLDKHVEIELQIQNYSTRRDLAHLNIEGDTFVHVNTWEDHVDVLIHLRDYYSNDRGVKFPTFRGVSFTPVKWQRFMTYLRTTRDFLSAQDK